MIIYKTRWFEAWANKQGLSNLAICHAVQEMQQGLYEADLGGGLFKKRLARQGQGKSGGFRTLIATNKGDRWFFVFGFAKNTRSSIDKDEERALKKLAGHLLTLSPSALITARDHHELIEVVCHEKSTVSAAGSST